MKKSLIIFLCLASICFADKFTSSLKPTTDSAIDIGTSSLLWRKVYADAFTDNFFLVSEGVFSAGAWQADTIEVPYGGTGKSSHTAGGILLGDGIDPVISLGVATNGQIPVGDGSGAPVLNTITAGDGTGVANGPGTITISLDPTTLCDAVWCNRTQDFITWQWDLISDDPTLIFRVGEFDFTDDNINTTGLINGVELGTLATDNYWFGDVETMSAGANLVTASNNIGIGADALEAITTGDDNVAIGTNAGAAITLGKKNIAIGTGAGGGITALDGNILIGNNAGAVINSSDNIGIGSNALLAYGGNLAIAIGPNAVSNGRAGAALNIGIGKNACLGDVGGLGRGDWNIGIGEDALRAIKDGQSNIGIGQDALKAISDGDFNIGIGEFAGASINTGNDNIGLGANSLDALTTGSDNIAIGQNALSALTAASNFIAIGEDALASATGGTDNIAVGQAALTALTTGNDNITIGTGAGFSITTADDNIIIGVGAGLDLVNFNNNVIIGNGAGANTTDQANTFIGTNAANGFVTGASNVAIGFSSMGTNTTNAANQNVAVGVESLRLVTTGDNNVVVGYEAGEAITTESGNVFLGNNAGQYHALGDRLIIDNQDRTNQAGEIADSLIYGVFDAVPANQTLALNATVSIATGLTMGGDIAMGANAITDIAQLKFNNDSTIDAVPDGLSVIPVGGSATFGIVGNLAVSTGLITGANNETLSIGGTNGLLTFTEDGTSNVRLVFVNDNGSGVGVGLSADATRLQMSPAASQNLYLFENAGSGDNPIFRTCGYDTGASAVKCIDINVDNTGTAVFSSDEDISFVPGSGNIGITGDLVVSGSVTAAEYLGGSAINLRETVVNYGPNDSATISIVAGTTWTFNTDNVNILQLALRSEKIILDAEKNAGTPTIDVFGDLTSLMFKENSRAWLSADWGDGLTNRLITLCEDVFHEQVALPIKIKDKFDGFFVEIDSFAGTTNIKGNTTFDPADGGNWAGAVVIIGDSSNHIQASATGDLSFVGTATVWNDLQFQVSSSRVPAANFPNWEAFTTNTYEFAFDVDEFVYLMSNELHHTWKEDTAANVHLHITNKTAQNTGANRYAQFTVYIAYADTDETWQETSLTAELTIPTATGALTNFYLDMGDLTLTNYLVGAQIKCTAKRIAATGGVEYADSVFITQVGMHLEEDSPGSRTELIK